MCSPYPLCSPWLNLMRETFLPTIAPLARSPRDGYNRSPDPRTANTTGSPHAMNINAADPQSHRVGDRCPDFVCPGRLVVRWLTGPGWRRPDLACGRCAPETRPSPHFGLSRRASQARRGPRSGSEALNPAGLRASVAVRPVLAPFPRPPETPNRQPGNNFLCPWTSTRRTCSATRPAPDRHHRPPDPRSWTKTCTRGGKWPAWRPRRSPSRSDLGVAHAAAASSTGRRRATIPRVRRADMIGPTPDDGHHHAQARARGQPRTPTR